MKKKLIDTNIFLEAFLEQEKSDRCAEFLSKLDNRSTYISRFSLYSIGIILTKHKRYNAFRMFINQFVRKANLVELGLTELMAITGIVDLLDFDDSYQYLCCKKYDLELVSLDKDFDRTDLKRIEP